MAAANPRPNGQVKKIVYTNTGGAIVEVEYSDGESPDPVPYIVDGHLLRGFEQAQSVGTATVTTDPQSGEVTSVTAVK